MCYNSLYSVIQVARRLTDSLQCFFLLLAAILRTAVSGFCFVYPSEDASLDQHVFPCCSPAKLLELVSQHDLSVEAGLPTLAGYVFRI